METAEIIVQLNTVFRRVFENENINITVETTAMDVEEWDSLSHTILMMEVEKFFNVKFKLKEMLGFKNIGDMVNTIQTKLAGA